MSIQRKFKEVFKRLRNKIYKRLFPKKYREIILRDLGVKSRNYFMERYPSIKIGKVSGRNKDNDYLRKYGFRFSMYESEYYALRNGNHSELYVPIYLFSEVIRPYLNRVKFAPAYDDKNLYDKVLEYSKTGKLLGYRIPETVVKNISGFLYNSEGKEINFQEAIELLYDFGSDMFIKPSLETYGGEGVMKIRANGLTKDFLTQILNKYVKNYIVQGAVEQNEDMCKFNPTSLNTMRIYSYRNPRGDIKILATIVRFGGKGAEVDNATAGGGFCYVYEDGTVDRKIFHFKKEDYSLLDNDIVKKIPKYTELTHVVKNLHKQLHYFNYIGWDFAIDKDDYPVFIEYNFRADIKLPQITHGPLFEKADLDEIMAKVSNFIIKDDNFVINN